MEKVFTLPKDVDEVIFRQATTPISSPGELLPRDVDRYFSVSLFLYSNRFNQYFFKDIKLLHLNARQNASLKTWKQIVSFIQRCSYSLEDLTIEGFNFEMFNPREYSFNANATVGDGWENLSLPRLQFLTIISCSGDESIKLLKAVSRNSLKGFHLNQRFVHMNTSTEQFFSTELLQYLQMNQSRLEKLKLKRMYINKNSWRSPLDDLLRNLTSLSLAYLYLSNSGGTELLTLLRNKCRRLSFISLQFDSVANELVKDFCISQRRTLENLQLSHDKVYATEQGI